MKKWIQGTALVVVFTFSACPYAGASCPHGLQACYNQAQKEADKCYMATPSKDQDLCTKKHMDAVVECNKQCR